jgi:uncharacterized protein
VPTPTSEQLAAASFPHETGAIDVYETHLSIVVLTGEFAYKIKKAVRLDFIDTTSLERRRELCEEELRLNRRYAPELYLSVVPLTLESNRFHFGGTGVPIEYAVQMRQFDRQQELQALLDANAVGAAEIAKLAELLADFQGAAATLNEPEFWGTDAFLRKARENVASVARRAPRIDADADALQLNRWTEAALVRQLDVLRERERHGLVRECHGDLHSRNVVRWRSALIPFDCIEFDVELRFIDVLNDIAFLVMDLIDRDRDDLAFTLLNRYLERTGDYGGMDLLPCYLTYRALVRAKVELIALEQHPDSSESRQRALSLLQTALRITRPNVPTLILMHGVSGSGKSWLSEQLVPRVPALRIRSDLERKRLAGLAPLAQQTSAANERIYSIEFNERTYGHLLDCARACLRAKVSTIVDAAFLKAHERRAFATLAREESARFLILACHADLTTLAERIEQRHAARNDPSDADRSVLQRQLETMLPFDQDELAHVMRVDTRDHDEVSRALERACDVDRPINVPD